MQPCLITVFLCRRRFLLEGIYLYIQGRTYEAHTPASCPPASCHQDWSCWFGVKVTNRWIPANPSNPHFQNHCTVWIFLPSLELQLDSLHSLNTPNTDKSKALNYWNETISMLIYFKAFSVPSVWIPLSVTWKKKSRKILYTQSNGIMQHFLNPMESSWMSTRWRALRKYFQGRGKSCKECLNCRTFRTCAAFPPRRHVHCTVHRDVKGTLSESVGSTDKTDAVLVPAVLLPSHPLLRAHPSLAPTNNGGWTDTLLVPNTETRPFLYRWTGFQSWKVLQLPYKVRNGSFLSKMHWLNLFYKFTRRIFEKSSTVTSYFAA